MKTNLKRSLFKNALTAVTMLVSLQSLAKSDYVVGNYDVDPAHTRVSFVVPHLVVSEVEGRFTDLKGDFILAEKFEDSKVNATVQVKSIDTGIQKRDDHLRSKEFFDVEKYPAMKLETKKITGKPDSFELTAKLTIKDVTKEVVFTGKYTGSVKDPWGQQRAALQLKGKINRQDFNVKYDEKVLVGSAKEAAVGNEVEIVIRAEGTLAVKPVEFKKGK